MSKRLRAAPTVRWRLNQLTISFLSANYQLNSAAGAPAGEPLNTESVAPHYQLPNHPTNAASASGGARDLTLRNQYLQTQKIFVFLSVSSQYCLDLV
jgi:hypothetical protein